jgi:hypothetical protein
MNRKCHHGPNCSDRHDVAVKIGRPDNVGGNLFSAHCSARFKGLARNNMASFCVSILELHWKCRQKDTALLRNFTASSWLLLLLALLYALSLSMLIFYGVHWKCLMNSVMCQKSQFGKFCYCLLAVTLSHKCLVS